TDDAALRRLTTYSRRVGPGTPTWRPILERLTLGLGHLGAAASGRRQARDDFRFCGIRAGFPLRQYLLNYLDTAPDLLIRHRLDPIGVLDLHFTRDKHSADLQIRSRCLAPNPLERLSPMLLPVLRHIEQKALVERSARSLR